MASVMGTPYDYPLSSRFDEQDAFVIFDDADVENNLGFLLLERGKRGSDMGTPGG